MHWRSRNTGCLTSSQARGHRQVSSDRALALATQAHGSIASKRNPLALTAQRGAALMIAARDPFRAEDFLPVQGAPDSVQEAVPPPYQKFHRIPKQSTGSGSLICSKTRLLRKSSPEPKEAPLSTRTPQDSSRQKRSHLSGLFPPGCSKSKIGMPWDSRTGEA